MTEFDNIPYLAPGRKKGKNTDFPSFDNLEGAGLQKRRLTASDIHEMASPNQGVKGHQIGNGNIHNGPNSLTYGEDNLTGIADQPFTCTSGSPVLTIVGMDVTDDFRVGDVVRIVYANGVGFAERVINGSALVVADTVITLDSPVASIVSGRIYNHSHGNNCINIGLNNHIKGDYCSYFGVGGRIARDVTGAHGGGIRNEARHGWARMAGTDGNTDWTGESYQSFTKRAVKGDRKVSYLTVATLTAGAVPANLLLDDGSAIALPTDSVAKVTIELNAMQVDGAAGTPLDTYGLRINAVVKNTAGVASIVQQDTPFEEADAAFGGTAVLDVDGANLVVEATGEANKNISWVAEVKLVINKL